MHDQHKHSSWRTLTVLWSRERWTLPGLLAQNILCMNEYIYSFQPRYVEETGPVLRCAVILQPHPIYRTENDDDDVEMAPWTLWWLENLNNLPTWNFVWSSANLLARPSKCFIRLLENILLVEKALQVIHTFKGQVLVQNNECSGWPIAKC